jgi:pyruvate dehydrogenase (quinone)
MAKTTSDLLIERLLNWGVDTIFGFPGDGINGIFEALRTHEDQMRFIQVRHEEAAAFAACAYAKYSGRLGVCLATSGPGGIHLLNGLYDAKCDGQPVLAITGHTFHDLINTHYQQDVDLDRLYMDVAEYSERVMGPEHVVNVVDEAIKTALTRHGVAHINIPKDIQGWEASEGNRSNANIAHHSADLYMPNAPTAPSQDALKECDVLIIAGAGMPYMEFYPDPGQAKCVQIDYDADRIGLRYPADVGLVGDCGSILRALLPLIEQKTDLGFLEKAQSGKKDWA